MSYQYLKCAAQEGVAVITLNRPDKRNALSMALRSEIVCFLDEIAKNNEIKVVVLTGAGPVFCAGFDLSEFEAGNMEEIFPQSRTYHRKVYTFSKPLIAAVNGPALAGGMDLATMCDIRVASEMASFGQPQVKLGIPAAYDLIHTVLPENTARELCLTGRQIDAQEAFRVGLVNRIVPAPQLMEEVINLAKIVAVNKASHMNKQQFLKEQPKLFE